jgi:pyridinium-3,5-biscarboxylic acid mononucleotide sulfurtransferase
VPDELAALADQLIERLAGLGSALIAFSGGVDSSLVAALAARALGEQALAVTAVSPALASGELDGARSVARAVGVRHELISTAELERDDYRRNDRFRCYYCKTELYDRLAALALRRGFAAVLSGANAVWECRARTSPRRPAWHRGSLMAPRSAPMCCRRLTGPS